MPTYSSNEPVIFDPFRTIQKVQWANATFIWAARFVGAGGATEVGAHEPSAFYFVASTFTDVSPSDNAKDFLLNQHPSYFEGSEAVAKIITGGDTFWFFGATSGGIFTHQWIMDTSACFGTGVGSLQAHARLWKRPPADTEVDIDGNGYFKFSDLMAGTNGGDYYDTPGLTTLSVGRWNRVDVEVKIENTPPAPPTVLNPPIWTWRS